MKKITVPAKLEYIDEILDFVNGELEKADCSMKMQAKIDIALDEIFTNIASYAYQDSDPGDVTVKATIKKNPLSMQIQFIDGGKPYNPLENEDPDITLSAEDRDIGGLGIFIAKEFMDSMEYVYKNKKNILTIQKSDKI